MLLKTRVAVRHCEGRGAVALGSVQSLNWRTKEQAVRLART